MSIIAHDLNNKNNSKSSSANLSPQMHLHPGDLVTQFGGLGRKILIKAVSHNRTRRYFRIQHGRGEVRSRRVYLHVNSVARNVVDTNDLLSFGYGNTVGSLETTPKAARGCGIRR